MDWSEIKHFAPEEFGDGIDEMLVRQLDNAREYARVPFILTSTVRSPQENEDVGGVPGSSHLLGYAVDIKCIGSRMRHVMLKALFEAGFVRIGIGETFLHADIDPKKPQEVAWLYD